MQLPLKHYYNNKLSIRLSRSFLARVMACMKNKHDLILLVHITGACAEPKANSSLHCMQHNLARIIVVN